MHVPSTLADHFSLELTVAKIDQTERVVLSQAQ